MRFRLLASLTAILLPLCACDGGDGDGGGPICAEFDAAGCAPTFAPTYDDVFAQVLEPRCRVSNACHDSASASGAGGGFVVSDPDTTYEALTSADLVVAGDGMCSPLSARVNTDDDSKLMPPGAQPMPEGLRCALTQWIENGAER